MTSTPTPTSPRGRGSIQKRLAPIVALALVACAQTAAGETAADKPTFTRDVLPILQAKCQDCHRPGQIAPMSLTSYAEVRPWAKGIRTAVTERVMPPFHADAPLGRFTNDTRLAPAEIDLIARWVDAGAPEGNPSDAPPPVDWPADGWKLGEPDLILEFPAYTSRPDNEDVEIVLFSDHVFANETWISAFELRPSNYRVVHHVGVMSADQTLFVPDDFVLNPDDEHLDKFGGASNGGLPLFSQKHLYTWQPGQRAQPLPDGSGYRVRAGDRIALQTHIAPTSEPIEVRISLGIWYVNGKLRVNTGDKVSQMVSLELPPGEPSYVFRETNKFHTDVLVHGFNVHMHLRGKSSHINFHYPDGTTERVFDLPRYSFDWQRIYWLAEPMNVPSGTTIEFVAEWDNSPDNPLNPDPTATVVWGGKTTDEMYGGHVYYTIERKRALDVVNGVVVPRRPAN